MAAEPATVTTRQAAPRIATYEVRANERDALQSQSKKLQATLAAAVADRDRAVARAAVDGSTGAREAREAAVGAVMRAQADLDAVTSALARLEAQRAENAATSARNKEVARLKSAADAAKEMQALAAEADAALAVFAEEFRAVNERIAGLYRSAPAPHHELIFLGGAGLSPGVIAEAAKRQLAASGLVPRDAFPRTFTATMAGAVGHFTASLLADAEAQEPAKIDWD